MRQKQKRSLVGSVVSNKMDKTVVVSVSRRFIHPTYKKYITRHTKFKVHEEKNECQVGDKVRIIESRPLSRRKCWTIQEKLA